MYYSRLNILEFLLLLARLGLTVATESYGFDDNMVANKRREFYKRWSLK